MKYVERQRTLFLVLLVFLFLFLPLAVAPSRPLKPPYRTLLTVYIPIAPTNPSRYAACICFLKQFQLHMRQILNLKQLFT
jgi:hypothetical protein